MCRCCPVEHWHDLSDIDGIRSSRPSARHDPVEDEPAFHVSGRAFERILWEDMMVVGAAALFLMVVVPTAWGWKSEARVNSQKRALLRPLEGQYVTLGSA